MQSNTRQSIFCHFRRISQYSWTVGQLITERIWILHKDHSRIVTKNNTETRAKTSDQYTVCKHLSSLCRDALYKKATANLMFAERSIYAYKISNNKHCLERFQFGGWWCI